MALLKKGTAQRFRLANLARNFFNLSWYDYTILVKPLFFSFVARFEVYTKPPFVTRFNVLIKPSNIRLFVKTRPSKTNQVIKWQSSKQVELFTSLFHSTLPLTAQNSVISTHITAIGARFCFLHLGLLLLQNDIIR